MLVDFVENFWDFCFGVNSEKFLYFCVFSFHCGSAFDAEFYDAGFCTDGENKYYVGLVAFPFFFFQFGAYVESDFTLWWFFVEFNGAYAIDGDGY